MIVATIEYFDRSQRDIDEPEPTVELYHQCHDDIADGNVNRVPPQLHGVVDEESQSEKLDMLFEKATAEIFKDIFNLEGTNLLG